MSIYDDVLAAGARRPARLSELTASEVDQAIARQAAIGVVVGSVEQHGPHLPVGTDLYIPQAILDHLTLVLDCVAAPPIPYGCRSMPQTGGGEFFGGNLSVDGSVLGAFAEGVIAQIIRLGFTRVLLLSWHWENMRVLWEAGVRAYETVRNPDVTITVIDNPGQLISATTIARVFGEDFAGWDLEHASIAETSLMEWLYPDLVRAHLIVDDEPQGVVPYEVIPANRGRAPRSGVFGPATRASRDKGDLLARDLTEGIGEIISRELKVVNASPSRTLRGRSAGRAEQGEQRLARSHGTAAPDAGGSSSEPDEAGGF